MVARGLAAGVLLAVSGAALAELPTPASCRAAFERSRAAASCRLEGVLVLERTVPRCSLALRCLRPGGRRASSAVIVSFADVPMLMVCEGSVRLRCPGVPSSPP